VVGLAVLRPVGHGCNNRRASGIGSFLLDGDGRESASNASPRIPLTTGMAYHQLDRFDEALESYRRAAEIYCELRAHDNEVETLIRLRGSHLALTWHRRIQIAIR
jgi:hypothetical protein